MHVRIVHLKTAEVVWHPLDENDQRFYPELEARLAEPVSTICLTASKAKVRGNI